MIGIFSDTIQQLLYSTDRQADVAAQKNLSPNRPLNSQILILFPKLLTLLELLNNCQLWIICGTKVFFPGLCFLFHNKITSLFVILHCVNDTNKV